MPLKKQKRKNNSLENPNRKSLNQNIEGEKKQICEQLKYLINREN